MDDIRKKKFHKDLIHIALPVTFQSLFRSSLSVLDQIMIGQLGSVSIAGIGLGGKFAGIFIVLITSISTAASILISQYYGKKDNKGMQDSFMSNFYLAMVVAILFTALSFAASNQIMSLYSNEIDTIHAAARYLFIISIGFIPMTITLMFSTLLRNTGYAKFPMYASVASVLLDVVLNYVMIFGKFGCPRMGLDGASLSTTIARTLEMLYIVFLFIKVKNKQELSITVRVKTSKAFKNQLINILYPLLIGEFFWVLGENMYAIIYGRIGTDACAAMTLTYPIQSLLIGGFTGLSAASGIMIGKRLGRDSFEKAYEEAKLFLRYAFIGTISFGIILALSAKYYVMIYKVNDSVRLTTVYLLFVLAIFLSVKVQNMILTGGIMRSGGKTKITLIIDLIGTWGFGVPLGMIAAYVFKLPIYYVYFILSLEECVRLVLGYIVFRKKQWMHNVTQLTEKGEMLLES